VVKFVFYHSKQKKPFLLKFSNSRPHSDTMLACSIGKISCHTIVETVVYTDSHLYQSKEIEVFVGEDGGRSRV